MSILAVLPTAPGDASVLQQVKLHAQVTEMSGKRTKVDADVPGSYAGTELIVLLHWHDTLGVGGFVTAVIGSAAVEIMLGAEDMVEII